MKVCIPATLRARSGETTTGWVVLRENPEAETGPIVVAFCWSETDARIVWEALKKPSGEYWVSRAWMEFEGDVDA